MILRQYQHASFGGALVGLLAAITPQFASAEETAVPSSAPAPQGAAPSDATTSEKATAADAPLANSQSTVDRLTALEQKVEAQQAQLKEQAARNDELEATVSTLSEQVAAEESGGSEDRRLSAWGFFDTTFGRSFYDDPHALYAAGTPRKWSFMSNGINLYLKSEMTSTLSAMVETRLTYTPVGNVSTMQTNAYIGGQLASTDGTFTRTEFLSRNPYSALQYRQNGLYIERAHFDWKPKDWFGVRVGRYLTPFGIWNEDHGSPVVLGVDMPSIITFGMVPIAQSGIELYGSRGLTDNLNVEYAVTISNGRGPIDEYKDLDQNKALGLRVKVVYQQDDLLLRLGGYAYSGRYTDRNEQVNIWLTPALDIDHSQPAAFGSTSTVTNSYRESIGTLDAVAQYKGLKVMGEFAKRKVVFDVAPPMDRQTAWMNDVPFGTTVYSSGYTGLAYYGVLAYELPLGESLGGIKVTPYVGADHLAPDQTRPYYDQNQYRMGLNVKPSPYVTTKLEATRAIPKEEVIASKMWLVTAQAAVAF